MVVVLSVSQEWCDRQWDMLTAFTLCCCSMIMAEHSAADGIKVYSDSASYHACLQRLCPYDTAQHHTVPHNLADVRICRAYASVCRCLERHVIYIGTSRKSWTEEVAELCGHM